MKKFFKIKNLFWVGVSAMLVPISVLADSQKTNPKPYIFKNPINANSLTQLIKDMFDAIIQIGLIFVIMAIIYSGFQFVVSQGNPEKLKKAKMVFLYTIIGGVILLGAQVITEVVCNTAAQFNSNLTC